MTGSSVGKVWAASGDAAPRMRIERTRREIRGIECRGNERFLGSIYSQVYAQVLAFVLCGAVSVVPGNHPERRGRWRPATSASPTVAPGQDPSQPLSTPAAGSPPSTPAP